MTLRKAASRPKQRWALLAAVVVGMTLIAGAALAFNTPLSNFEIDGDVRAGLDEGNGGGATAPGVDWFSGTAADDCDPAVNMPNAGDPAGDIAPCPALIYNNAMPVDGTPPGTNPSDNPAEQGHATFFRDGLKVDPDPTIFTQGDKENDVGTVSATAADDDGATLQSTTPWHITSGSVPPNKDDLFDITTYTRIQGADAELVLGMLRTNNNGSSHVDFELNRLPWAPCANDATRDCPVRVEGDLLVSFEISPSSVAARFFVWDLPGGTNGGGHGRGTSVDCEGPLTGQEKPCPWEEIQPPGGGTPALVVALNAGDIPAGPQGSRNPNGSATNTIPARGWFEAYLDLDDLGFAPDCPGFGAASAKSRASGSSVTSALTDLAGPFDIDLNTCGKVTIEKDAVPNALTDFDFAASGLGTAMFKLDDDAGVTGATDTLSNVRVFNAVAPGSKVVRETPIPTGYVLTSIACSTVTGSGTSVIIDDAAGNNPDDADFDAGDDRVQITLGNLGEVYCTFTNTLQQGAIQISKSNGKGLALQGAQFSIRQGAADGTPISGSPFTTNAGGTICVDGLAFGNYYVKETSAPTGYQIDDTSSRLVTVDSNATCADNPFVGEETAFTNTPLSTIGVTFTSQAGAGVTRASIVCAGTGGTIPAESENGGVDSVALTTNTAANPTVITTASAHGLITGAKVLISGSNSTPSIDGIHTVTVLSATTFSIPVDVTSAGSAGTVTALDDTNESFEDLVPGTYTCTIFVDP